MSGSGFLEKLLDGADVEWKPLGEIVKGKRGKRLVKSQLTDTGNFAVFQNSMTPLGYYHESNVRSNSTFIIVGGAAGEIGYSDRPFWAADDVYYFISPNKILNKFLYYWLLTQQTKIKTQVRKASVPRLSKAVVHKLCFPIPCPDNPEKSLAIQGAIVRILDTFTELTAELTARKKQYNYYRDQLLTFDDDDNVEWKPLGELGELVRGNGLPKKTFTETGVPAIHYGQIYTYYGISTTSTISFVSHETAATLKKVNTGDVIITNTSENFEDVGTPLVYFGREQAVTGGHATIFKPNNMILGMYFAYFAHTHSFEQSKRRLAKGTKVIDVSSKDMAKITIPIPYPDNPKKSLTEQQRIVAVLDAFNSLTTSLTEGLPREIKLRQQQYEYYRDQLLNFPKPDTKAA